MAGALSVPPSYSVTIDLNGHKICRGKGVNNMTDDGSVIRLFDKATLTINDTSENQNGSIEGGSSNYGGGNASAKAEESLPTSLNVISNGASLVENSFSVSPNDETAVKDTEYTITAKVKPDENCEFGADTIKVMV